MCDDDRTSVTSSSGDSLWEGSEYTDYTKPSDAYPSPLQETNRECVCNLSVRFLLDNGRFVVNSQNSYEGVGHCNSFQDEVQNDYFPFSLGGKCVEVGGIRGNLEFSVEYYDMQCLACGERTESNMYQDILRYEVAEDGYTRPRLSWFMDFYDESRKYSCILWRIDRKVKAEDGAVFGIWGADGPHDRLTFRVAARRKRSERNKFPCLQHRTKEQLVQLLKNNRVYMASKKEAEVALRQRLETGKPQWDIYRRWKFPEGVQSSTDSLGYDGVDAYCAACYNGKPRCEETFRLRKLVLKPFQHKEYRVLAYRIDNQTQDGKFVFFSKRRGDDTLRFLRIDWKYTDLALRFVRNGQSFNGHTVSQYRGPRKSHSSSGTITQKRTYHSIDAADPQPQKRVHTDCTSFNPINGLQSDERAFHLPSSAETGRHTLGRSEQSLQVASCHDSGHSDSQSQVAEIHFSYAASQSCDGQQTGSPLCQSDCVSSREYSITPANKSGDGSSHPISGSHTDEVAPRLTTMSRSSDRSSRPIITQEHIERVRIQNEELKIANARKQKEILDVQRRLQERKQNAMRQEYELVTQQKEEEIAKMAKLDTEIGVLKRALDEL